MFLCKDKKILIMDIPLLTWCGIVGCVVLLVAVRVVCSLRSGPDRRHGFIEIGSEREVFYLPGDPLKLKESEYDDFDDV